MYILDVYVIFTLLILEAPIWVTFLFLVVVQFDMDAILLQIDVYHNGTVLLLSLALILLRYLNLSSKLGSNRIFYRLIPDLCLTNAY